jgi:hypothetical protein
LAGYKSHWFSSLKTPESDSPLTILGFSQTEVTHVNPAVRVADYVPKVGKWL